MEFQLIEWFQVWLVKTARTYSVFYHIFIELHWPAALISSIYIRNEAVTMVLSFPLTY